MNTRRLLVLHVSALTLAGCLSPSLARAASVSFYGLGPVERYEQTGDTTVAPASDDAYAFRGFAIPTSPGSVFMAMITVPGSFIPLVLSGEEMLTGEQTFSSRSALEAAFPAGEYTFSVASMAGLEEAKLAVGSTTYPNTPQIANYTAAQAIDRTKEFVLNWNAFEGATANDYIQLTVLNADGNVVFQTGWPGQTTVLNGTARSVTIPPNRLAAGNNRGLLTFTRTATRTTTALAGATGLITAAKETLFSLRTGSGGGGGGTDTTPPQLLSVNPANMASNVPTNSPVVFTFSEAMAAMQEIFWQGTGVNAAKFTYSWSSDGRTLTCTYPGGFPANTMIVWGLETSGFQDLAGNELEGENTGGFFRTGSGQSSTNNPCTGGNPEDLGVGVVTLHKSYNYLQTSAATPVVDPEQGISFYASLSSPDTNPVTRATLVLPNGASQTLTNMMGFAFVLMAEFPTKEALDAAYPAGTYTVQMQRTTGSATLSINMPAAEPPIPQISDFDAVLRFDPAADLLLKWYPFTGAAAQDYISVALHDTVGTLFYAPDPCIPRPLANTDTSIVVPKNTFSSGRAVEGSLTFVKFSGLNTNSIPDIWASAGVSKETRFKLGNPSSTQVILQNFAREASGVFRFQVKAPANSSLIVEASNDLVTWSLISTGMAPTGVFEVADPDAASHDRRYYRARTLF